MTTDATQPSGWTWEEEYLREYFTDCDCGAYETEDHRVSATVYPALLPSPDDYHGCQVGACDKKRGRRIDTFVIIAPPDRERAKAAAERLGAVPIQLLKHWESIEPEVPA